MASEHVQIVALARIGGLRVLTRVPVKVTF